MINIDEKQKRILQLLCQNDEYVSLEWLQETLSVSKRTVYYLINKINDTLAVYQIAPIQNKRGAGYYIENEQKKQIQSLFTESLVESSLKAEDRIQFLICWLLYPDKVIHVETIMECFGISRNSVFSDLKKLKTEIQKYHLDLVYSPKEGYKLQGIPANFHAIFLHYIMILLQKVSYREIFFLNVSEVELYYRRLLSISDQLGNEYKGDNYLLAISCLLSITHHTNEKFDFSLLELKDLGKTKELNLIDEMFQDFNVHERLYLAIYLLGSKAGNTVAYKDDEKDIELFELAQVLTEKFEKVSRIRFSDKNELINSLYLRFKLSLYYYKISIQIMNPFTADVKKNYPDLYEIVNTLCIENEDIFPFPLSEGEIVYITIHFGGHIRNESSYLYRKMRVLIVCPSGISTSVLLRKEIENSFANIQVVDSIAVADIPDTVKDIDFIISTVDIQAQVPCIKVHTILSREDKSRIASLISLNENTYSNNPNGIEELLNIVYRYVDPKDHENVKTDIIQFLQNGNPLLQINEISQYRLCEVLNVDDIVLANKQMGWEEGIKVASRPLLNNGYIKPNYIASMINLVCDYGPYFVLRNGVALAHGKSNEGANMLGLSLLVNKSGVLFEDLEVKLLFVLSSPDQNKHLRLLRDIMELSEDEKIVQEILEQTTTALIHEKIKLLYHDIAKK